MYFHHHTQHKTILKVFANFINLKDTLIFFRLNIFLIFMGHVFWVEISELSAHIFCSLSILFILSISTRIYVFLTFYVCKYFLYINDFTFHSIIFVINVYPIMHLCLNIVYNILLMYRIVVKFNHFYEFFLCL